MDDFRDEYAHRYGSGSIMLGAPVELVTFRAVGIGRTVKAALAPGQRDEMSDGRGAKANGSRPVVVERGEGGVVKVKSYQGPTLARGQLVKGPALIDESDTTIWVPKKAVAHVDQRGNYVVEV